MNYAKPIDTPISTSSKLDPDGPDPMVNETMYREIIWFLLYLTTSKPDIVFGVWICVRFQSCPKELNLKAVKRIQRYLNWMGNLVPIYLFGDSFDLIVYADAAYARYQLIGKIPL